MKQVKILSTESRTLKANTGKITGFIKSALASKVFPYVAAALMLLCYYTGGDMVAIYFLVITGILMLFFLDDLTPGITLFLYLLVMISYKNSPSMHSGNSTYFYQPAIYIQISILAVLLLGSVAYRIIKTFTGKKFKPSAVFYTLCALSVVFLLNGIFSEGYKPMNLVYGLIMAGVYLGIFVLIKDNVKIDKHSYEYIANAFLSLSFLLVAELAVAYLTTDSIYVNGTIDRNSLSFGWGVYNTMGMLLLLCIPSVTYLASLYKHGYIFSAYSVILVICCFLSMSRQSMLGCIIIYPVCLFLLFRNTKHKKVNAVIFIVAAIAGLVLLVLKWNSFIGAVKQIFSTIYDESGELYGNGRIRAYIIATEDFKRAPILGAGFYSPLMENSMENAAGLDFIPLFYHNTILQMMASCGLVGLVVYTVHRIYTVFSFCNNINYPRSYICATISVLLILSLLDVHMFDILPTLVYSYLLAVLVASEKPPKENTPRIVKIRVKREET